ncbi:MAG TPA: tetratricopeptide repeat protein [Pyrinomonadaceae bacterium]|nr:tetratricopeptide repeat protein [Pyrinomonadaceae bacterium]
MQSKPALIAICALSLIPFTAMVATAQVAAGDGARLEQAATLISGDRLAEAEQQLNAILKAKPNDALALNLLGTVRAKQGRLDEAETLFSRAIRADNGFAGAHMNLAYLYVLKGVPEKTISELKEVLRLDPENADARYKLARLLFSQGRLDECVALIKKATLPLPAHMAVVLGDAYLKKGDLKKAEESYLHALEGERNDADALLGLALVSRSAGDANGASTYLARAKESIADSPESLYRFAVTALRVELFDDARWALERATRLRPNEPTYFVALGAAWLKKPELFEAERVFRQALRLRPDDPQAQMYLGYTLLKQKKYPEAREWLEQSVRRDAATPETFYYLGVIAQEQNEDLRAVEFFENAIRLQPAFANAHVALGSTYLKLKNYERARQELEAGAKLNPDDSKAHYNLARLYAQLKDPQRAQQEMRIVEKLKSAGKAQEGRDADAPAPSNPR